MSRKFMGLVAMSACALLLSVIGSASLAGHHGNKCGKAECDDDDYCCPSVCCPTVCCPTVCCPTECCAPVHSCCAPAPSCCAPVASCCAPAPACSSCGIGGGVIHGGEAAPAAAPAPAPAPKNG